METFEDLVNRLEAQLRVLSSEIDRVSSLHEELVRVIEQDTTDRKEQAEELDKYIARWKAGVNAEE